jgi:hypothetical protein
MVRLAKSKNLERLVIENNNKLEIVASFYATWLDLDRTVLYSDPVVTNMGAREL